MMTSWPVFVIIYSKYHVEKRLLLMSDCLAFLCFWIMTEWNNARYHWIKDQSVF